MITASHRRTLPGILYTKIPELIESLDGTRLYVHQSAEGLVRGGGPWVTQDPKFWFGENARGFMTEIGMPCVPPVESMKAMLPEENHWPIDEIWALHDYVYNGYPNTSEYTDAISQRFGEAKNLEDFCKKAQMLNLQDHKAMYEGFMAKLWNDASAVMIWMSHPAWPSTMWQLYDYYWEPTGAYWGVKKASEPINILWNPINEKIIVVNHTKEDLQNIKVEASVLNLDGTEKYNRTTEITALSNTSNDCFKVEFPNDLTSTHFVKLRLTDGEKLLSENFYWRGNKYLDYTDLETMPDVDLETSASIIENDSMIKISAKVKNIQSSGSVALAIRLKLVQENSGKRVLPAYYEDNYFSLIPGDSKKVDIEFDKRYLDGEEPNLIIEGWNIVYEEVEIK